MINVKEQLRTILTDATITALVPATRITMTWPDFSKGYPCIVYNEINSFTDTPDYFDDKPIADNSEIEIHIFALASTTSIFHAIDARMELAGWNRTMAVDLFEPDNKLHHKALRYTNVLYRV